jgi:serine/threonine protein kinase
VRDWPRRGGGVRWAEGDRAGARGRLGPGMTVGEFAIESVAGRGGMGVVYRARQREPDRVVALKVIAPELAGDPSFEAWFKSEGQIAARIEHPNVIPVYAVGEDRGILYIAMRFVVGTDLRAVIEEESRIEPGRAAELMDQVAHALDAAHEPGLVHRDVKPANILITAQGGREHVYLTDFGLTRHLAASQAIGDLGAAALAAVGAATRPQVERTVAVGEAAPARRRRGARTRRRSKANPAGPGSRRGNGVRRASAWDSLPTRFLAGCGSCRSDGCPSGSSTGRLPSEACSYQSTRRRRTGRLPRRS